MIEQAIFQSEHLLEIAMLYGRRILEATAVLLIGLWIIKMLSRAIRRLMELRHIDDTLRPFLISLFDGLFKVMLILSVLGTLGIQMTSFIAVLGAAGLAIGMALSGTLQNLAGGVILLLLKPYKVGDWIETQGFSGTVDSIQIFHTHLKTGDNKTVVLPNGGLATGSLINYSTEQRRRVEWVFGIGYGDSFEHAKKVLSELIAEDDRIQSDPEPFIALKELADSSVNIVVRVWVDAANYWPVHFDMNEKVYRRFDQEGLNIPYPQMDVYLRKTES
jgi:small conductance mechanosensitive channel